MNIYQPGIRNKGEIAIFPADNLLHLLDYSNNWFFDPIAVGNLILQHAFGNVFLEPDFDKKLETIIANTPDVAAYGIGYIEDYHNKRNNMLIEFITDYFNTLLCMFEEPNVGHMVFGKMQLLKFCTSGVYIYHE